MVLLIVPISNNPIPKATKHFLKMVIFTQYVPRLFRIFPVYKEVTRTSGIITETAWAGAALNLFLYIIASHVSSKFRNAAQNTFKAYLSSFFKKLSQFFSFQVVGAFWYLFAIERESRCWHNECGKLGPSSCKPEYLYCKESITTGHNLTFPTCILKKPGDIDDQRSFNYGIFFPALSSVVKSTDFPQKLLYCFWWGLRNLRYILF